MFVLGILEDVKTNSWLLSSRMHNIFPISRLPDMCEEYLGSERRDEYIIC